MTQAKPQECAGKLRALCLLLAGLLWLTVAIERPVEEKLMVPVRPERLPVGLCLTSPPSGQLEVTVSGPRFLLFRQRFLDMACALDLSGAVAGTVSFTPKPSSFGLDRELTVLRVFPASVCLTLAKRVAR